MPGSRAEYLIKKLIASELSIKELDELLAGIVSAEEQENYSTALEKYFHQLLEMHESELQEKMEDKGSTPR